MWFYADGRLLVPVGSRAMSLHGVNYWLVLDLARSSMGAFEESNFILFYFFLRDNFDEVIRI